MPVLQTKLFIPRLRPHTVPRPRLIEKLNEALRSGRKLTLVAAPAGFGKTTLLSEWITDVQHQDPFPKVAWLSLDEGDNDPSRFLACLLGAVNRADATLGVEAPSDQPIGTLTTLINEVSQGSHHILLVLDDFQFIEDPSILGALVFLLDHLPPKLHLVIVSRSDPLLPVARLRAGGELTELRAADLRFTPHEAATFLNQMMHLDLSAADITALEARTEGWIAGLQLAALSLRERTDATGFIQGFTGSNRFVIDYLVEEVLHRQPTRIRDFLLHTAILDRLSGPLCDAVTERSGSSEILASLERDNVFVVPLDDRRQWYRYHHLFADVLRARLAADDPAGPARLHTLASAWHEHNGLAEDAVAHALAAADFDRAARLIELAVPLVRQSRQDATLLRWLTLLPEDTIARRPVLGVYYAWSSLVSGDLLTVESRLVDAEHALAATTADGAPAHDSAPGEELRTLPVTIAVYRAALAQARGDVGAMKVHAGRALDLSRPGDHLGRGAAAGFLGLASWAAGDLDGGVRAFGEVRTSLRLAGNLADALATTIPTADMLLSQGRLREARRAYEQALQLAGEQGDPPPQSTGDLHIGLGELLRELGDLPAAAGHLAASEALGDQANSRENRYRWFVAMARIRQTEGDLDASIDLLGKAERHYLRGFFPEVRPIPAMTARVRIAQGRLDEAGAWADERGLSAGAEPVAEDLTYLREFDHLTLARLLIAQQKTPEALRLLERLLDAAETGCRSTTEILMLQALAHGSHGDTALALTPLARSLAQAEPEGYLRLFADEGAGMAALLREASTRGIAPDYVRRLQRDTRLTAGRPGSIQTLADPLSEREVQVVRLLASDLSGPDIARELYISVNTLRTHTKHIFAKLDVKSRPAAVSRAEALGLL
ncbi:LuxR C-terminal-related transcriptional regulator [Cryobacterium sp. N22]|uniref:LuxR C-terminal-related transcriptional regulator n=1 Tax=Cryobacterium sp. N22 TaxID=2048290 RepID=UPI000CE51B03|nr:LuxR C-terminal-related transcriptional regulator [Cryobacterium sp. N22]